MANVIPSFGRFGPKPDLAGASARGANVANQAGELALNIRAQADRVALDRARIQQQAQESAVQAQINQMRIAAQQQQAQDEALRRGSELAVQDAYNNARLGMASRELDQAQAKIENEARQMQRMMAAQNEYRRRIVAGEDPDRVGLELAPAMGVSPSAFHLSDSRSKPMTVAQTRDFYGNSTAMKELERQALAAEEAGASPEVMRRDFGILSTTPPCASIWAARMRPEKPVKEVQPRISYNPESASMGFTGTPEQVDQFRSENEFMSEEEAIQSGKKIGDVVRIWDEKTRRFRQARLK